MDTTWLKWVTGNRLTSIGGIRMDAGVPMRYSEDYTYIEIPLAQLYNPSTEEVVEKAANNQLLRVIPACRVDVRGRNNKIVVKTNPMLQEYASCPSMFLLDAGEGEQPTFHAKFHRAMESTELKWAVRLYLVG